MASAPGSSGGRPESVVPKSTSRVSAWRASTSAQAACVSVLSVS
nr:hypothetical protein [Corallococcus sp. CA049B]